MATICLSQVREDFLEMLECNVGYLQIVWPIVVNDSVFLVTAVGLELRFAPDCHT